MSKMTIESTIELWVAEQQQKKGDPNAPKNLRTALKRYVFEELGYETRTITPADFSQFCCKLTVEEIAKKLKALQSTIPESPQEPTPQNLAGLLLVFFDRSFQAAVEAGKTSARTGSNYRSALGKFVQYLEVQSFWQLLCPSNLPEIRPKPTKNRQKPSRNLPADERPSPYVLRQDQLSARQRQQLEIFEKFWTTGGAENQRQRLLNRSRSGQPRGQSPKVECISADTYKCRIQIIFAFWGFLLHILGWPLSRLSLELLIDASLITEYNEWMITVRQSTHANAIQLIGIAIAFCKLQNFDAVQRRNWSDIDIIEDLRALRSEFNEKYKKEHQQSTILQWESKKLKHSELQQICRYLYECCAPFGGTTQKSTENRINRINRIKGARRSKSAQVWAWQVYLIVSIFTYVPVRQQEVRQYGEGKTIFKETTKQGQTVYVARNIKHKLQRHTGKPRAYCLPSILHQDLELWLKTYRPLAQQATESLDNWLDFVGYKPDALARLQQRLTEAKQDQLLEHIEVSSHYVENLEAKIRSIQSRCAAWQTAKENFERYDSLLFSQGKSNPKSFGNPLSRGSIWSMVSGAVAEASKALFGEERRLNPHKFRHVAAYHVRLINGNKNGLSLLMNHSEGMGDEYAQQLQDDLEQTASLDEWWL
ncbi:MAG TPA: hypothetical protein V6C84_24655 [Coleofasciculaceae cyanobacterium]